MAISLILASLLQGMLEVDHHLYFNNVAVPNPPLWSSAPFPAIPVPLPPSDREDTPSTVIDLEIPPVRAVLVDSTSSLLSYQSVPTQLPLSQVATPSDPCHLCQSRSSSVQTNHLSGGTYLSEHQKSQCLGSQAGQSNHLGCRGNGCSSQYSRNQRGPNQCGCSNT